MKYYIEFKTNKIKGEAVVHHEPVEGSTAVVDEADYLSLVSEATDFAEKVREAIDAVSRVVKVYRVITILLAVLALLGWVR